MVIQKQSRIYVIDSASGSKSITFPLRLNDVNDVVVINWTESLHEAV